MIREMVDVNDFHKPTDLNAYFKAGYPYLGIKVTEGIKYTSVTGLSIAGNAKRAGGRRLFYHFATASAGGADQAAYFLAAIKPHLQDGDAIGLDIEGQPKGYPQWSGDQAQTVAASFQTYIDAHLLKGVTKLVYSNSAFFSEQNLPMRKGWRRWVASYGLKPGFWPKAAVAWQFTDKATGIPGMPPGVDASYIQGALIPGIIHRITPHRRYPTLRFGATGPSVRLLQSMLDKHGFHILIDGRFGPATVQAVHDFKIKHHLTRDAVCGRRCWKALEAK